MLSAVVLRWPETTEPHNEIECVNVIAKDRELDEDDLASSEDDTLADSEEREMGDSEEMEIAKREEEDKLDSSNLNELFDEVVDRGDDKKKRRRSIFFRLVDGGNEKKKRRMSSFLWLKSKKTIKLVAIRKESETDLESTSDEGSVKDQQLSERLSLISPLLQIDDRNDLDFEMVLPNVMFREECDDDQNSWETMYPLYDEGLDHEAMDHIMKSLSLGTRNNGDGGDEDGDPDAFDADAKLPFRENSSVDGKLAPKCSWNSETTEKIKNVAGSVDVEGDTPWLAAKRGDLDALKRWSGRNVWALKDKKGHTPLYYACRKGAAKDLWVVWFVMTQWKIHNIPREEMKICYKHAANSTVRRILRKPDQCERLILEFKAENLDVGGCNLGVFNMDGGTEVIVKN